MTQTTMIKIENGIKYVSKAIGAYVEVRNDEKHFTIYTETGKPLATLLRPRYGATQQLWEAFDLNGARLCAQFGPRVAFARACALLANKQEPVTVLLSHSIRILWNMNVVMQADCTSAMAYDTMNMMFGNFVNIRNQKTTKISGDIPKLAQICDMKPGDLFAFTINDGTAGMTINITRKGEKQALGDMLGKF